MAIKVSRSLGGFMRYTVKKKISEQKENENDVPGTDYVLQLTSQLANGRHCSSLLSVDRITYDSVDLGDQISVGVGAAK